MHVVLALASGLVLAASPSRAAPAPGDPDLTVAVRETADVWRNLSGGLTVGNATLNKLQISATWTANRLNDPQLGLHLQIFRTDGAPLTRRTGDVQTASNIEAVTATRLFEAWAEQGFGEAGKGGVALRAGLIDLNSDFDSIDPASLFIDSSHGIAPDLSKSGLNGPSIFPVSAAAVRLTWTPSDRWTVRGGLFDGVAGDPGHPKSLVRVRLRSSDGALAIAQADRKLGENAQVSLGVWRYSARLPAVDGPGVRRDEGVFGFVEGPAPGLKDVSGWVRVGRAAPRAQLISGYLGAGLVKTGLLPGRPDDQMGVAISDAVISPAARRALGLRHAETTFEATYQMKLAETVAMQPDLQYIVHPASQARLPSALLVGFRVVLTAGFPSDRGATQAADPPPSPTAPSADY